MIIWVTKEIKFLLKKRITWSYFNIWFHPTSIIINGKNIACAIVNDLRDLNLRRLGGNPTHLFTGLLTSTNNVKIAFGKVKWKKNCGLEIWSYYKSTAELFWKNNVLIILNRYNIISVFQRNAKKTCQYLGF